MTAMIVLTATTVQTRVLPRTGAKPLVMAGMTLGMIAMILFTQLTPHGAYVSHVLPGLLLTGVGMGCIFAPAFSTATLGVKNADAGIASAMVNTSQQVGGSVGTALLSTIFASAAASFVSAHAKTAGLASAAHDPRLHHRVRMGGRPVRSRAARRAARSSLPMAPPAPAPPKPQHPVTSTSALRPPDPYRNAAGIANASAPTLIIGVLQ